MSIEALTPLIRQILSAPHTDLSTISAKRVRTQLLQADPSLSEGWVRENKQDIDKVIAGVFEEISAANVERDAKPTNGKRKHEDEDNTEIPIPSSSLPIQAHSRPPPPKQPKLSDEQVARLLESEINSRPKRAAAPPVKAKSKAKAKGGKKSKAVVGSDGEEEEEGGEKKKARGGFGKEFILSAPLATLLDTPSMSRPQVVKHLWVYIKSHSLQNPANKKEIICDDLMRGVFGVDKIGMFEMNKVLGRHLYEKGDAELQNGS